MRFICLCSIKTWSFGYSPTKGHSELKPNTYGEPAVGRREGQKTDTTEARGGHESMKDTKKGPIHLTFKEKYQYAEIFYIHGTHRYADMIVGRDMNESRFPY